MLTAWSPRRACSRLNKRALLRQLNLHNASPVEACWRRSKTISFSRYRNFGRKRT